MKDTQHTGVNTSDAPRAHVDVEHIVACGFEVVPVVPGKKKPTLVNGHHGGDHETLTEAQRHRWAAECEPPCNWAIVLPPNVIGIDVDAYKGDEVWERYTKFLADNGLDDPPRITPRGDHRSGIRLFRLPPGVDEREVRDLMPGGIEVIRHSWRYCMAPGSIHPDYGTDPAIIGPYALITRDDEPTRLDQCDELPAVTLPGSLVYGEAKVRDTGTTLDDLPVGEPCRYIVEALRAPYPPREVKPPHSHMLTATMTALNYAKKGHGGAKAELAVFEEGYLALRGRRKGSDEYQRALASGLDQIVVVPEVICDGAECGTGMARIRYEERRVADGATYVAPAVSLPDNGGFGDGRRLVLRGDDDIEMADVKWLVPDTLPRGALCSLVGEEGIGKGLWWSSLVADLNAQGYRVGIISTEDDASSVIKPRLRAAGAVPGMWTLIDASDGAIRLPEALPELTEHQREQRWDVLIVDPWLSTLSRSVKDSQAAALALDPLGTWARDVDCVVLLVVHPNRLEDADERSSVGVSGQIRRACRSMLFAVSDPEQPALLYVGVEKTNYSVKPPAVLYEKGHTVKVPGVSTPVPRALRMPGTQVETIREVRARLKKRSTEDGRLRLDRWEEVKRAATDGLITRGEVVALYDGKESSADEQMKRWRDRGWLELTTIRRDRRVCFRVVGP